MIALSLETTSTTDPYDESRGGARHEYEQLLQSLEGADLRALDRRVARTLDREGVTFGATDDTFRVDPVPRLLHTDEWEDLAAGLCQRVRALDRFVADVYGRQEIVREGVVPARAIRSAEYFEAALQGMVRHDVRWIGIAGLDVVRCPDGSFKVLEDNVRTPSGIAYALAARQAVSDHVGTMLGIEPEPLHHALAMLSSVLEAAAPEGCSEPFVALLTDGPENSAYFEHELLAQRLGLALLTPRDVRVRDRHLVARVDGRDVVVDVVYRRTNEDRVVDDRGELTDMASLLAKPWAAGNLGLVNAFGTGVADDKLVHAYAEDAIRFYLGEEPLIKSVPTFDLLQPGRLERALDRLEELVVKPRAGHGGEGVLIGSQATRAELDRAATAMKAQPGEFIVQETVPLSVHPTVCEGRLEPRHVDLRPFVFLAEGDGEVMPGGLTRVAFAEGELVVNSSRDGGAKDTWVVG